MNEVKKQYINILDQIFEIERKLESISEDNSIGRNLNKLKTILEEDFITQNAGLVYENPIGQDYDERRTDLDATISGDSVNDLVVTEVIKPIIRLKQGGLSRILRPGVVIVKSKNG